MSAVPGLIRSSLETHPALRSQQGRQQASSAGLEAARWQFWPVPSVSVESVSSSQFDASFRGDRSVATLRLQQPLFTGGRLSGNLDRAKAQVSVSEADYLDARQQLALRVLQAWTETLTAQRKIQALRVSRAMHERLLGLVQRRHADGVSALADVALASSRINNIESELQLALTQRDTAQARLTILTGSAVGPRAIDPQIDWALPVRAQALGELLEAAVAQSPAIARANALAEIALADIRVSKAALSPELYFRLERQYGSYFQAQAPTVDRAFVGLSTAIGGGLSSVSNIQAAVSRHQAANDDLQVQKLALEEQIQADFSLANTSQARRRGLESSRDHAVEVLLSYERQFLAGRKQWQDLMNAAREQSQAEMQLADVIGAQQLTNWRLALLSRGVDAVLEEQPIAIGPARN